MLPTAPQVERKRPEAKTTDASGNVALCRSIGSRCQHKTGFLEQIALSVVLLITLKSLSVSPTAAPGLCVK
jgi:hypothetical protein